MGLGSNIGDSQANIEQAINKISLLDGVKLGKQSQFYLTKAWGKTDQQDFINAAIQIKTTLKPGKLLKAFQTIESSLGRERIEKWGPRIIDIDILLYGKTVVNQPQLTIPHAYITQRSFVLAPLFELNHKIEIPGMGKLINFIDNEKLKKDIIKVF